jgi:hypothetical protein
MSSKVYEVLFLLENGVWHQVFRKIDGNEVDQFETQNEAVAAANQAAESPRVVEAAVFEVRRFQVLVINGKARLAQKAESAKKEG